MNKLDFFVPVTFPNSNKTLKESLLELADNFFYLGGKRAKVIEFTQNSKTVVLDEGILSNSEKIAKIIAGVTIVIPLFLLATKFILRSKYQFKVIESPELKQIKENPIPNSIEKVQKVAKGLEVQSVTEEPQVKNPLSMLTSIEEVKDYDENIVESLRLLDELEVNPPTNIPDYLKSLHDLEGFVESITPIYQTTFDELKKQKLQSILTSIERVIDDLHHQIAIGLSQSHKPNTFIPGDGNCLFWSIAAEVGITGQQALRLKAANYLRSNREKFESDIKQIEDRLADSPRTFVSIQEYSENKGGPDSWALELQPKVNRQPDFFDFYCDCLENSSMWGGTSEIQALSQVFQKPVILIAPQNGKWKLFLQCGLKYFKETPILLYYNGDNHYQNLIPFSGKMF